MKGIAGRHLLRSAFGLNGLGTSCFRSFSYPHYSSFRNCCVCVVCLQQRSGSQSGCIGPSAGRRLLRQSGHWLVGSGASQQCLRRPVRRRPESDGPGNRTGCQGQCRLQRQVRLGCPGRCAFGAGLPGNLRALTLSQKSQTNPKRTAPPKRNRFAAKPLATWGRRAYRAQVR